MESGAIRPVLALAACTAVHLVSSVAFASSDEALQVALSGLLTGVADNVAATHVVGGGWQLIKERFLPKSRTGVAINHILAREVRLAQLEAMRLVAKRYGSEPETKRFVASVETWVANAKVYAASPSFLELGVDDWLGAGVDQLLEKFSASGGRHETLKEIAEATILEELQSRVGPAPDKFLRYFKGDLALESGWCATAEAIIAHGLFSEPGGRGSAAYFARLLAQLKGSLADVHDRLDGVETLLGEERIARIFRAELTGLSFPPRRGQVRAARAFHEIVSAPARRLLAMALVLEDDASGGRLMSEIDGPSLDKGLNGLRDAGLGTAIQEDGSIRLAPEEHAVFLDGFAAAIVYEIVHREHWLVKSVPLLSDPENDGRRRALLAVADRLKREPGMSAERFRTLARQAIISAREEAPRSGYLAGNVVNLLGLQLGGDLSDENLSHLDIRNVDFRNLILHRARLDDSDVHNCAFADTFGSIWKVDFDPSGEMLVASGVRGQVLTWSAETGQPGPVYGAHNGWSFGFAIRPTDGQIASAGGDSTVLVWNRTRPAPPAILQGHVSRIRGVAYHPRTEKLISCAEDQTVRVWTQSWGKEWSNKILYRHDQPVTALVISPDGSRIVTGSRDGCVIVWRCSADGNIERGAPERQFQAQTREIRNLSINANGLYLLSAGDDDYATVWSLEDGNRLWDGAKHDCPVRAAAFDQCDNTLLVTGDDQGLSRCWRLFDDEPLASWRSHRRLIRSIASTDGGQRILTGGDDQTVKLFLGPPGRPALRRTYSSHLCQARALAWHPHNPEILVTGHDDAEVRFWRLNQQGLDEQSRSFDRLRHDARIWSVAFTADGTCLVTGSEDGTVRCWTAGHSSQDWQREVHRYRVFSVAVTQSTDLADGLIASGGSDRAVLITSLTGEGPVTKLVGHKGRIRQVAFSPSGDQLASASEDGDVRLWRRTSDGWSEDRIFRHATTPEGTATAVCFHPDRATPLLATAGEDGRLAVWDMTTGKLRAEVQTPGRRYLHIDISKDGWVAAGSEDGMISLWDSCDLGSSRISKAHNDWVEKVAFSPDGTRLASVSDDELTKVYERSALFAEGTEARSVVLKDPPRYEGLSIENFMQTAPDMVERLIALGAKRPMSAFHRSR